MASLIMIDQKKKTKRKTDHVKLTFLIKNKYIFVLERKRKKTDRNKVAMFHTKLRNT